MRTTLFILLSAVQVLIICLLVFFLNEKEKQKEELALDILMQEFEVSSLNEDTKKASIATTESKLQIPFKDYISAVGVIESANILRLSSLVEGKVEDVFAKIGDYIEEGDQLLYIQDDAYRINVEKKSAEVRKAIAKYNNIMNQTSSQELLAKKQEVEEALALSVKYSQELDIYNKLYKQEAVTPGEIAAKQYEYKNSQAVLERLNAELSNLQSGPNEWERKVYTSEIEMQKAALSEAELTLENCLITSPIEGVVIDLTTNRGENVSKDETVIVIASTTPMQVRAKVFAHQCWRILPEKNLRAIAVHKCNPKLYHILTFDRMSPIADESGTLDVIFKFTPKDKPVYFGEEYDIYIEAISESDTSYFEYQFKRNQAL